MYPTKTRALESDDTTTLRQAEAASRLGDFHVVGAGAGQNNVAEQTARLAGGRPRFTLPKAELPTQRSALHAAHAAEKVLRNFKSPHIIKQRYPRPSPAADCQGGAVSALQQLPGLAHCGGL